MDKYCIIGAGFSGLLTALYLSKQGEQVVLLEQHDKVGGLYRTEQSVPIGAHHLGIPDFQAFQAFFEDLGIKDLELIEANSIALVGESETFPFSFKVDEQEGILLDRFPTEIEEISKFYAYLNRFIDVISNNDQLGQLAFFKETAFISFEHLLSQFNLSTRIRRILSSFGPAYAGVTKDDSAFTYLSILSTYGKGGYYLSETSHLTTTLSNELQKYSNCQIRTNLSDLKLTRVGQQLQVEFAGEKHLFSQLIIACFPLPLLQQLSDSATSTRLLKELSTLALSPNVKRFYFEVDANLSLPYQEFIGMNDDYYMISLIKQDSKIKYAVLTLIELDRRTFEQEDAERIVTTITGIKTTQLRRIRADNISDFDEKVSVFGWYRNAKGNLMSNKLLNLSHYFKNTHLVGNWGSSFGIYGSFFSVRKWIQNVEKGK